MTTQSEILCVICQDNISTNTNKICLPCAHSFHTVCITEYIQNKAQQKANIDCPICRTDHFKYNDEFYKDILYMLNIDIPIDAVAINTNELMRRHNVIQQNVDIPMIGNQQNVTWINGMCFWWLF
jgi:hypothetical protein